MSMEFRRKTVMGGVGARELQFPVQLNAVIKIFRFQ